MSSLCPCRAPLLYAFALWLLARQFADPCYPQAVPANDIEYMRMALEEAHAAAQAGEVPVGAILVIDDQVVARASNRTITDCDPSAHAEIVRFEARATTDRKSTRLNSSHGSISYAVFCLKTKTKQ